MALERIHFFLFSKSVHDCHSSFQSENSGDNGQIVHTCHNRLNHPLSLRTASDK